MCCMYACFPLYVCVCVYLFVCFVFFWFANMAKLQNKNKKKQKGRRPELHENLKLHSKRIISSVLSQIQHTKSSHLRTMYARVLGHWCLFCKKKYVDLTMQTIETLYTNISSSNNSHSNLNVNAAQGSGNTYNKALVPAVMFSQICKDSQTIIMKYPKVLAIALVGMQDPSEEVCTHLKKN